MAFRDQLLPASLDGVPFLYKDTSSPMGRRTTVYEFPDRDEPFVEDLGRLARRFSLQALVLEPDYFIKRDALIEVLEREGPYTLIHPTRGELQVRTVGPIEMTETVSEGGMASWRLTFVEAGSAEEVLRLPDTSSRVALAADRVLDELGKNTKISILDAIQDAIQGVINGIEDANSKLRAVNGKIQAKMNTIESLTQAIDSFEDGLSDLLNTPQQLVNQFSGLTASVLNLINTAAGIGDAVPENTIPLDFDRPNTLLDAWRLLDEFAVTDPEPPDTTPQRKQEATNQDAVEEMVKVSALAETSRQMALLDLDSADQAQAIRTELTEAFDDIGDDDNTEDGLFEALQDLRNEIANHLQQVAQDLPVVSLVTPANTIPALVLAYNLYTDAEQDLDIVARNNIKEPGFIPGGAEIEVLSTNA